MAPTGFASRLQQRYSSSAPSNQAQNVRSGSFHRGVNTLSRLSGTVPAGKVGGVSSVAKNVPRPVQTSSLKKENGGQDVTAVLVNRHGGPGKKVGWGSALPAPAPAASLGPTPADSSAAASEGQAGQPGPSNSQRSQLPAEQAPPPLPPPPTESNRNVPWALHPPASTPAPLVPVHAHPGVARSDAFADRQEKGEESLQQQSRREFRDHGPPPSRFDQYHDAPRGFGRDGRYFDAGYDNPPRDYGRGRFRHEPYDDRAYPRGGGYDRAEYRDRDYRDRDYGGAYDVPPRRDYRDRDYHSNGMNRAGGGSYRAMEGPPSYGDYRGNVPYQPRRHYRGEDRRWDDDNRSTSRRGSDGPDFPESDRRRHSDDCGFERVRNEGHAESGFHAQASQEPSRGRHDGFGGEVGSHSGPQQSERWHHIHSDDRTRYAHEAPHNENNRQPPAQSAEDIVLQSIREREAAEVRANLQRRQKPVEEQQPEKSEEQESCEQSRVDAQRSNMVDQPIVILRNTQSGGDRKQTSGEATGISKSVPESDGSEAPTNVENLVTSEVHKEGDEIVQSGDSRCSPEDQQDDDSESEDGPVVEKEEKSEILDPSPVRVQDDTESSEQYSVSDCVGRDDSDIDASEGHRSDVDASEGHRSDVDASEGHHSDVNASEGHSSDVDAIGGHSSDDGDSSELETGSEQEVVSQAIDEEQLRREQAIEQQQKVLRQVAAARNNTLRTKAPRNGDVEVRVRQTAESPLIDEELTRKARERRSEEEAAAKAAREEYTRNRGPRTKGVLFRRLPDGTLVNADLSEEEIARREEKKLKKQRQKKAAEAEKAKKAEAEKAKKVAEAEKAKRAADSKRKKETDVERNSPNKPKEFVPAPPPPVSAWTLGPPPGIIKRNSESNESPREIRSPNETTCQGRTLTNAGEMPSKVVDVDRQPGSWTAPMETIDDEQKGDVNTSKYAAVGPIMGSWDSFAGRAPVSDGAFPSFSSTQQDPVSASADWSVRQVPPAMTTASDGDGDDDEVAALTDASAAVPRDLLSSSPGSEEDRPSNEPGTAKDKKKKTSGKRGPKRRPPRRSSAPSNTKKSLASADGVRPNRSGDTQKQNVSRSNSSDRARKPRKAAKANRKKSEPKHQSGQPPSESDNAGDKETKKKTSGKRGPKPNRPPSKYRKPRKQQVAST